MTASPDPAPESAPPAETGPPARRSRLPIVLLCLAALVALGGFAWWWVNRPIEPVVLSEAEQEVVAGKVEAIRSEPVDEREYVPGEREIVLTERELNGLLNQQTGLGDRVKFELARDAIHARVEADLDPDLPVLGGRKLKGRARFLVSDDGAGTRFVLDDVTLWGVSLPNDWLGGLKGRDLVAEVLGGNGGGLPGVESLAVSAGKVTLRLKE